MPNQLTTNALKKDLKTKWQDYNSVEILTQNSKLSWQKDKKILGFYDSIVILLKYKTN